MYPSVGVSERIFYKHIAPSLELFFAKLTCHFIKGLLNQYLTGLLVGIPIIDFIFTNHSIVVCLGVRNGLTGDRQYNIKVQHIAITACK